MDSGTYVKTDRGDLDSLVPAVRGFLEQDVLEVVIEGKPIRGYRSPDARSIWIRDYADMMRGFRHFETDMTSVVEEFADTQAANGRIFDYFTTFPEKLPSERENWTKYVRVPVEADVEYAFIKAAFLSWQATGDNYWIRGMLPSMDVALRYISTHPWRWDEKLGLVKRAYTIDTWDFAYTAGKHDWLQFQIDDDTIWGIFHGDNTGYYEAFRIMETLYRRFGEPDRANHWKGRAAAIRTALNRTAFNGDFYTHFVKLTDVTIDGVDETKQLSLSNPKAINRGATCHAMSAAILNEYQRRRKETDSFAEWFSIDPPFPDGIFGDEKLVAGAYINGGIMPLVGGELARAAFEHGFEEYGVDILTRYAAMVEKTGETYLWYFPDGTPSGVETSTSPEARPTDGWGSSAMLYALIEGLAGITEQGCLYRRARIAPRWPAAGVTEAEVRVGYECSGAGIGYTWQLGSDAIEMEVTAEDSGVLFHVMLPEGVRTARVTIGGEEAASAIVEVENSRYVDFEARVVGNLAVRVV